MSLLGLKGLRESGLHRAFVVHIFIHCGLFTVHFIQMYIIGLNCQICYVQNHVLFCGTLPVLVSG